MEYKIILGLKQIMVKTKTIAKIKFVSKQKIDTA